MADAAPPAPQTDEAVIAAADWLTRAGNAIARWRAIAPQDAPAVVAEAPATPAEPIALARDDAPASSSSSTDDNVEHASLDGPLALGVAAVMSFRYHQPLLRWLKRNRTATDPKRTANGRSSPRGPHTRF